MSIDFRFHNFSKVTSFDIAKNGIQIIESDDKVEIYNDPFRTVPLFITKGSDCKLVIFSNFEDFYSLKNLDKTVDEVGFWEIVLFGSGLWSRTLYKNVKQMPGASKIVIDKRTYEYKIERYWGFNVSENGNIDSIEKAALGLYERLDAIFSKLDRNQKYTMGLSGGLDSRITLAFLAKYIPKENLELFTYGFDRRLLEYKYACGVAEVLGCNKPKFHVLTKESYKRAMKYLPQMSGAQISINHCHILDFLHNNKFVKCKQISTYYSDAIFGWDSTYPKNIEDVSKNFYIKSLDSFDFLTKDVKEAIKKDSFKVFESLNSEANFSSLDEYKYFTERNQKFHIYLASIQGKVIDNQLLFANYQLLEYMLSVPIKFREQKQLVDYLLNNYFKNLSSRDFKTISSRDFRSLSSRFQWNNKFSGLVEFYLFKFLNRFNALLRPLTKGHIQVFNKYQTEEQERLLYRDFDQNLKNATSKFLEIGLMNAEQKKYWDKLPIKTAGISERYQLISIDAVI